ncbi:unnamed protein product [Thelazia callipaeda]|uniref:Riboflavin transporter n=1 Tax=Thelazia callipaeda TaxID=103827 RepID=A0A0N5D0B4_THECL|nr:unnamed protein product [Thelazia callipaeda]
MLFGSTSWLSTDSLWMELPLLTDKLPEGWNLPSYLTVIIQLFIIKISFLYLIIFHLACGTSLVFGIIYKYSKFSPSATVVIFSLLIFCSICTLLMALFWSKTLFLFGQQRSVALMVLLFGMALVNGTSNVLFMPYMAAFHPSYLTAYFVGMGLSALFPSLVSILQVVNGTAIRTKSDLNFGIMEYNCIMLGWLLLATLAFILLDRSKDGSDYLSSEKPYVAVQESSSPRVREASALNHFVEAVNDESRTFVRNFRFGLSLFLLAIVSAQMNGIIPSVQSYASLPYSQKTYHFGLTIENIISPIICFLPLVVTISSMSVLVSLTLVSSVLTGFVIILASMSPTPILLSSVWGPIIAVSIAVCAFALNSFLRTVLATVLGEGNNETRLFWGGLCMQVGSLLGSVAMFLLINIFELFVSASSCS